MKGTFCSWRRWGDFLGASRGQGFFAIGHELGELQGSIPLILVGRKCGQMT